MKSTRLEQLGAAGRTVFVVLQMVAQALMQIGGAEPCFDAPAPAIAAFFMARNSRLFALGSYLSVLSLAAFPWLLGSLWSFLRRAEGEPAWLSGVALASDLMVVEAVRGTGGWELAAFRKDQGLDPQIAWLRFDQGNITLANRRVGLASLGLAKGAIAIRTWVLPAAALAGMGRRAVRRRLAGSACRLGELGHRACPLQPVPYRASGEQCRFDPLREGLTTDIFIGKGPTGMIRTDTTPHISYALVGGRRLVLRVRSNTGSVPAWLSRRPGSADSFDGESV